MTHKERIKKYLEKDGFYSDLANRIMWCYQSADTITTLEWVVDNKITARHINSLRGISWYLIFIHEWDTSYDMDEYYTLKFRYDHSQDMWKIDKLKISKESYEERRYYE